MPHRFAQVDHLITTNRKMAWVVEDDARLGRWLRLLLAADAAWPAPADRPRWADDELWDRLEADGIIEALPRDQFTIHDLGTRRDASPQETGRRGGVKSGEARRKALHEGPSNPLHEGPSTKGVREPPTKPTEPTRPTKPTRERERARPHPQVERWFSERLMMPNWHGEAGVRLAALIEHRGEEWAVATLDTYETSPGFVPRDFNKAAFYLADAAYSPPRRKTKDEEETERVAGVMAAAKAETQRRKEMQR